MNFSRLKPISGVYLTLKPKSFTRRKIRLKPSCGISASFVTLLLQKNSGFIGQYRSLHTFWGQYHPFSNCYIHRQNKGVRIKRKF